jgi:hypothetical protein
VSTLSRELNCKKAELAASRNALVAAEPTAVLRVGDLVQWSHAWALQPIKEAKIIAIEFTSPGSKYGESVSCLPWSLVGTQALVTLNDGSAWAYGYQIAPIA